MPNWTPEDRQRGNPTVAELSALKTSELVQAVRDLLPRVTAEELQTMGLEDLVYGAQRELRLGDAVRSRRRQLQTKREQLLADLRVLRGRIAHIERIRRADDALAAIVSLITDQELNPVLERLAAVDAQLERSVAAEASGAPSEACGGAEAADAAGSDDAELAVEIGEDDPLEGRSVGQLRHLQRALRAELDAIEEELRSSGEPDGADARAREALRQRAAEIAAQLQRLPALIRQRQQENLHAERAALEARRAEITSRVTALSALPAAEAVARWLTQQEVEMLLAYEQLAVVEAEIAMLPEVPEVVYPWLQTRYDRFIRKHMQGFYLPGGDKADLFQVAALGFAKATKDYSYNRQTSFVSFAALCIKRHVITAIKNARRDKHAPLNGYTSMDSFIGDSERTLSDVIAYQTSQETLTPEERVILSEQLETVFAYLKERLSPTEFEVFTMWINGNSYEEIRRIKGYQSVKQIDNALQRARKKIPAQELLFSLDWGKGRRLSPRQSRSAR